MAWKEAMKLALEAEKYDDVEGRIQMNQKLLDQVPAENREGLEANYLNDVEYGTATFGDAKQILNDLSVVFMVLDYLYSK